ncbi:MAG: DUF2384 domain-containing protein [Candidatus Eremiobacteraeota bacterium]|nr:DUF2384 domain-containing protein [Candidatus Eremiobacteraeota bacterium]
MLEKTIHNAISDRLDARGVAKLYNVRLVQIATALGKNEDTVRKNPDSDSNQESLGLLVDAFSRLYDLMAEDEHAVRRWLHRPNRGLDGERPIELLSPSRLPELRATVREMETTSYS